jgi:hypothetical protein
MKVSTAHFVQLPEKAFDYFDRAWKIDDCDPNEWKEYVVLGINWVCTRLKNGVSDDGYWEYEVSKPTGLVTRVQVSEDWLINAEQLAKEKERYAQEQACEQAEAHKLWIEDNETRVYFQQELTA